MPIFTFREPGWDLFREMARLQRRMSRLYEETLGPSVSRWRVGVLVADMPGVSSDRVTLDIRDNNLTITGEIRPPMEEKETMLVQEFYTGDYQREFQLGANIDRNRIEAAMKDGVLRLTLPKSAQAKPRKIEVKVG